MNLIYIPLIKKTNSSFNYLDGEILIENYRGDKLENILKVTTVGSDPDFIISTSGTFIYTLRNISSILRRQLIVVLLSIV